MEWSHVAASANGVVSLTYFAVSYAVFVPLRRAGQLRSNRLGTATCLIFFSCAVGHGLHSVHGGAGRAVELHDAMWAVLTAAVGIYYWTLRRSYGRLLEGAALFEDHATRKREAVEVNDTIVQCLVAAKMAKHLGRDAEVDAALDAALDASRELVGRLLHDAAGGGPLGAGDFVRGQALRRVRP